jgi:hypothetical protein
MEANRISITALIAYDHAVGLGQDSRKVGIAVPSFVGGKKVGAMNMLKVRYPANLRDANVALDVRAREQYIGAIVAQQSG